MGGDQSQTLSSQVLVNGTRSDTSHPVLWSDVSLSFWGGIDPLTGVIIDQSHPLAGQCVTDTIFCLPSGRGSCTASQVLLELIVNGKAPKAIILRDRDGLVCVGAIVAQAVFPESAIPHILQIDDFARIGDLKATFAQICKDGKVVLGTSQDEVDTIVQTENLQEDRHLDSEATSGTLDGLILTEEEQIMLKEATNAGERRAAECLIRYAHIVAGDAPTSYVEATQAHIDGCTYIGPAGLKFVKRFVSEGCKVKVPTTLNSVSTDLRNWQRYGIKADESQLNSIEVANAYLALGCSEQSFTCAPYLLQNRPTQNDQIVWGESNAVVYANSVLGARTEKYADYLDICCAIVGKAPNLGVHEESNRKPKVLIDASCLDLKADDEELFSLLFPVLGHLCGTLSDGFVPILVGLEPYADQITSDHLKAFCAAFGTTGTSPLIHIAGITPEAKETTTVDGMVGNCDVSREVTAADLEETYKLLDQQALHDAQKIDWIAIGNPHLSLSECDELLAMINKLSLQSQQKNDKVRMIACMSRDLFEKSSATTALEKFGIEFVNDTCWCMLLKPPMIPASSDSTILTNSGKYAHYGPGLVGRRFRLGSLNECVQAAVSGNLPRRSHANLPWTTQSRSYSGVASGAPSSAHSGLLRGSMNWLRRIK